MSRELVCISCPRGCNITVDDEMQVSGNSCKRGVDYAIQELKDPRRILTLVLRVKDYPRPISLKTDKPVPKDMLIDCAKAIYALEPNLPIHCGDIILEDILGTGCNAISTCDAE